MTSASSDLTFSKVTSEKILFPKSSVFFCFPHSLNLAMVFNNIDHFFFLESLFSFNFKIGSVSFYSLPICFIHSLNLLFFYLSLNCCLSEFQLLFSPCPHSFLECFQAFSLQLSPICLKACLLPLPYTSLELQLYISNCFLEISFHCLTPADIPQV